MNLDYEAPVIRKVLDYLYSGAITIEGGDVQDILILANYIAIQVRSFDETHV